MKGERQVMHDATGVKNSVEALPARCGGRLRSAAKKDRKKEEEKSPTKNQACLYCDSLPKAQPASKATLSLFCEFMCQVDLCLTHRFAPVTGILRP